MTQAGSWASSRPAACGSCGAPAGGAGGSTGRASSDGDLDVVLGAQLQEAFEAGAASAPAPAPRSRAAAAAPGRCRVSTSTSHEVMNWSMMTCAPLAKSPNCASHMHQRVRDRPASSRTRSPAPPPRKQAVVDVERGLGPARRLFERLVPRRPSLVDRSTACRWLKVPRRLSWPLSRTGVPSAPASRSASVLGERPVHCAASTPSRLDPGVRRSATAWG